MRPPLRSGAGAPAVLAAMALATAALAATLLASLTLATLAPANVALTATAPIAPAPAAALPPRTSLPAVESQVMCVTCKIPLTVAQSPQADRERAFIQELINQGQSEAQIKQALVGQYGPQVLALPATHGFSLAAYLVPIALGAFVLVLLVVLLPRWRRRGRVQAAIAAGPAGEDEAQAGAAEGRTLSPADAARLEADLARFD